jgi:hypothetical protein
VGAADLEVVRIVARGDLERARPELRLDVRVGDDPEAAADERQDRRLPHEPAVAIVIGMHGDGGVGQHGLRAHRGHGHRAVPALERVVDPVERVGDLALLHLEVGDRRAGARVPVDHAVVAVDQALLVEGDEDAGDRVGIARIEREPLVGVVAGRAEALELLPDGRAVLLAPLPDALDERLAAERLALDPLRAQQLLHLGLGGDPGVVGAEDPLGPVAEHPVVAGQGVLDGAVERVAHVQRAGHVRRRDGDGVGGGLAVLWTDLGMEDARGLPPGEDPRLDLGRLEAGALGDIRHRAREDKALHFDKRCHSVRSCRPTR